MKIITSLSYGGFDIDEDIAIECGIGDFWSDPDELEKARVNEKLISLIESGVDCCEECELVVNQIPDEATDWHIFTDDTIEELVYVLDGKMYFK